MSLRQFLTSEAARRVFVAVLDIIKSIRRKKEQEDIDKEVEKMKEDVDAEWDKRAKK